MYDDDELPYIQRATASGILIFFAEAERFLPQKYTPTPENSDLLDLLFKSRRASPGSDAQFEPEPRPSRLDVGLTH